MEPTEKSGSFNKLSLMPREVLIGEEEQMALERTVSKKVDMLMNDSDYDHSLTISTLTPIQLDARPLSPPGELFNLLVKIPYPKAHIEAVFDQEGEDELLLSSKILLFYPGTPHRCEILIIGDEDTYDGFDPENPSYIFVSNAMGETENIPLDISDVKQLLSGLVSQSNEYDALTRPNPTIAEAIHSLLAVSDDISVSKQACYEISVDPDEKMSGSVKVSINQRTSINKDGGMDLENFEASVTKHRPIDITDEELRRYSDVTCTLAHTNRATALTLDIEFGDVGSSDNHDSELIDGEIHDFNEPTLQLPGKFTTHLLDGLDLLEARLGSSTINRLS